jgi:hypothetical protein
MSKSIKETIAFINKVFRKVSLLRNQALPKELFSIGKKAKRAFLLKMPTGS